MRTRDTSTETLATQDPVSILLVDDQPANLLALEAVLEPLGQRLVRAVSGDEALAHLERDEFAVVLLDLHMPAMDGLETLERMRRIAAARNTPVIIVKIGRAHV